jgi:hypothetical protein
LTLAEQVTRVVVAHRGAAPTAQIGFVAAKLARAGVPPEVVEQRTARGDLVVLAFADEEVVGYSWATFTEAWIAEIRATMSFSSDEAVRFNYPSDAQVARKRHTVRAHGPYHSISVGAPLQANAGLGVRAEHPISKE